MGEDRRTSADSPADERATAPEKRCEHCGALIDTTDWYPVTKERDGDGTLRLYHFCSEGCQAAWLDD